MQNMKVKSLIFAGLLAAVSLPPAFSAYAQEKNLVSPVVDELLIQSDVNPPALALDQAIQNALERSPILGASSARLGAASANLSAAGVLPNPSLSIEAENIYGDDVYDGLDSAEITYGVSQLVEMPGKQNGRKRIAKAEQDNAYFSTDVVRFDLIRDVTIAFAELATAQQEIVILEDEMALVTKVRDSVAAKVLAGKEPPIQKNKSEIELSASKIALDRAHRKLAARKQTLESLMGESEGYNSIINVDSMPAPKPPEPIENYRERLHKTPDALSLRTNIARAKAELSLEKANSVPDPTVNVGVRDFRENNSQAFVVGLSIPFPVFNVNRAGIKRAGHDLTATALDEKGFRLNLESALIELYANCSNAYNETIDLKTSVLPGADARAWRRTTGLGRRSNCGAGGAARQVTTRRRRGNRRAH